MAISIELPGLGTGHLHGRLAKGDQKAAAGSWTGETHGGETEIDAKDFWGDEGFHDEYIYHRQE